MAFYLAIDNGGTKTDYVLADESRTLARVRSNTIKRMRTDEATATENLVGALRELTALSGVSMEKISRTCIGTAGESVPLVAGWLREAITARVAGEFILVGDVEIALDAAFQGGQGVLVLAGTGSNVAGRTVSGRMTTAGGWGPALADQGSGNRVGQHALRSLFLALDEGCETSLLRAVLDHWALHDENALIAYANQVPPPDFAKLAELVLHCANGGDTVAAGVLHREGTELGYLVRMVVRRLLSEPGGTMPELAFAGSMMEKVTPVRDAVLAEVQSEFAGIVARAGVIDPIDGALWRARHGCVLA